MSNPRYPRYDAFIIFALPLLAGAQQPSSDAVPAQTLAPVVVTATRAAQTSANLPVSIDQVDRQAIQENQPMVNLSEPLAQVPGVVAKNRYNYAQDLQISVRGFGARASFGVRGVRLYADGIPATMPDGQGQVSHIDLGSARSIEILRGPFSTLYGNSSGGVISIFTEEGRPGLTLQGDIQAGSHGTQRLGIKTSGQSGRINHVLSASRFSTDGFRPHSAAARDIQNAKLRIALDIDSSLTLVGNGVQMRDVQDPLGLTRAQFDADPRSTDARAIDFNTRKSVDQHQIGLRFDRDFGRNNSLHVMVYGGQRATVQYLAIPPAAQAPPTQAGGVIDLARNYWGADLRWTHRTSIAGAPLQWTLGLNYDQLDEDRRGYENFIGATVGVTGRLRRDEANRVYNADQYFQAQWQASPRWLLLAGVRNSMVAVRSNDRYIVPGNGDDSGSVRYRALTPVLGTTFRLDESLNLYGAYGRGFETPTFNELSYRSISGTETGLNFALTPARSKHVELGLKAQIGRHLLANAALFHVDTENELTVQANSGGRAVYQNAARTRRDGLELRLDGNWRNGFGMQLAYSYLRAAYAQAFCSGPCTPTTQVVAGNTLPGVPRHHWYGELRWRHAPTGFAAALETRYAGQTFVNDLNNDAAASYLVANLRAGLEQKSGPWRFAQFIRVDNITDRSYAGSVIVNEGNRRFFEPAPGRHYLLGVTASYSW